MGGKIDYFDYCNSDLMSMIKIENMLKQLGYESTLPYYYRNRDTQPWFKLENDKQLMSFLNTNYGKRSISIYVESNIKDDPIPSQVEVVVDLTPTEHIHVDVLLDPTYSLVHYSIALEMPVEIDDESIREENNGSDVGSDEETELKHFNDSEYEEDDKMFDDNVDLDVEWGGFREKLKELDERGSDDEYPAFDDLRSIDDSSDE